MSGEDKPTAAQPKEAQPTAEEIMARVAATVAEKVTVGLYDPDEVRRVEEAAVSMVQAREDGAEAELNLRSANLQKLWDAKVSGISTHRGGAVGKLLLKIKQLLHKVSSFPLGVWLARQVQFNDELVKLTNVLVPQHSDLRHRMTHSEGRLDSLEEGERRLISDLHTGLGVVERRLEELRRDLEPRLSGLERAAGGERANLEAGLASLQATITELVQSGAAPAAAAQAVAAARQDARGEGYLMFEDMHRGERAEIKERQRVYLDYYRDAVSADHPLVDLGCGRGEFLELCKDEGINAKGVDINPEMAARCQELGLDAEAGDAIAWLREQADASLGGILMAQVIEHLELNQLTELISLCAAKLAPGGVLIAETINPQCLTTFSGAFYLDLTHNKPVHPEAARFLWRWAGLGEVEVVYLSPYPPDHRLESFTEGDDGLAGVVNRNVQRLNGLLYSHQDYAVVGRR